MRRLVLLTAVLSTPVLVWDGFKMFSEATTGPTSGGGGIWGTGSKRDHAITCAACHAKAQSKINVALTFTRPVENAGAGYKGGRR